MLRWHRVTRHDNTGWLLDREDVISCITKNVKMMFFYPSRISKVRTQLAQLWASRDVTGPWEWRHTFEVATGDVSCLITWFNYIQRSQHDGGAAQIPKLRPLWSSSTQVDLSWQQIKRCGLFTVKTKTMTSWINTRVCQNFQWFVRLIRSQNSHEKLGQ